MLSIILPAYNEEQMIPITVRTLAETMGTEIPYELVFIDDGSRDKTWDVICAQAQENPHILGIHFSRNFGKEAAMFAGLAKATGDFSRNFGKEAAMFAGLAKATGDCCVVMDCDLQHPPEKVVEMYHLWQQGYEVVEGVKEDRGRESAAHRFAAKSFYKLISDAAGMDMSHSSDFKLLDRKVVDTLNALPERNVFFRALSYWVGYRKATVSYCVQERTVGESKWSTRRLIRYALTNIAAFSTAPMQIVTFLGVLTLLVSIVFGCISLYQKIAGIALSGFTTVILLLLFFSSILMISLGIIGFYISRIYVECQGRPRYIISQTCGTKQEHAPTP